MTSGPDGHNQPPKVFATTHWSVVLKAGDENSAEACGALEHLCRTYWYPVYAEIRRRGFSAHNAQDLTQEFFACLLRRNSFAAAERTKGRFRSYLIGALNYFLADESERQHAEKRGGRFQIIPLESEDAEGRYLEEPAAPCEDPGRQFDASWRATLMDEAFVRLKREYTGKEGLFEEIKGFLAAEVPNGSYEKIASTLGMNPNSVGVSVHRLRQRYAELVRAIVSETVVNPTEVDDELRQLFSS